MSLILEIADYKFQKSFIIYAFILNGTNQKQKTAQAALLFQVGVEWGVQVDVQPKHP